MIRKAVRDDATRIHVLLKQILVHHKEMYPKRFPDESKYTLQQVEALIENSEILMWVSEDEFLDGYVIVKVQNKILFIDDLCVDKHVRGKHIGQSLVDTVIEYGKLNDYAEIQLNVWLKNHGAIAFYDRLGFEPLRTILTYDLTK